MGKSDTDFNSSGGDEGLKYTTEESLSEIMHRKRLCSVRRNQKRCRALSGMAVALFTVLAAVITVIPDRSADFPAGSVYGAFLLSPEAGGYVLAAVIAFALGVTVTLLCLKWKKEDGSL